MKTRRGISLIEIIVVIAILGILSAITVTSFSSRQSQYRLDRTTNSVSGLLEKAYSRAVNSYNDVKHSVRLESSQAILFEGTSYSSGAATNQVYEYEDTIELISTSINGGGTTITFDKVSGATSHYGSITFAVSGASTSSSTIYISQTGVIYNQ
jgi:prepilin-type N-terminal cleavage/methylation domain-containing protein